jgi:hypothetical protein
MDKNTKDILASLNFIKERMLTKEEGATKADLAKFATKDDVRSIVREEIDARVPGIIQERVPGIVALELKPVRAELKDINDRLDVLEEHYRNLKGLTKEIDDIRERVRAIEKHLGLNRKIAA